MRKAITIDWTVPLVRAITHLEAAYKVKLSLDSDIVAEISSHLRRTMDAIPMDTDPNVAKIAGHVTFWIRKLKPIRERTQPAKLSFRLNS